MAKLRRSYQQKFGRLSDQSSTYYKGQSLGLHLGMWYSEITDSNHEDQQNRSCGCMQSLMGKQGQRYTRYG